MMKKPKKRKYLTPEIQVMHIELEQGIAASSATVSGGNSSNPYQPEVEEWNVDPAWTETQNGDL